MPDYTMKAPGVYIEEQAATGPIAGVSTSVAAFIGPTAQGPQEKAILITNWTQFRTNFGGYIPGSYMAHAVRGFFDNGGTLAYIVCVGTGAAASLDLPSTGKVTQPALQVRARQEGKMGNAIQVAVAHTHIVSEAKNAEVVREAAEITSAAGRVITLKNPLDKIRFVRGDTLTIEGSEERAEVDFIADDQPEIHLLSDLADSYDQGTVRIADLVTGQRSLRIQNFRGIEIGSVIRLSQNQPPGGVVSECHTVTNMAAGLVTLASEGVLSPYSLAASSAPVKVLTEEFTLTIQPLNKSPQVFANVSMNSEHSRYFLTFVNSEFVELVLPTESDPLPVPENEPAELLATNLQGGEDITVTDIDQADYKKALDQLAKIADISLVCVPGCTDVAVQGDVVESCQKTNRFAILDSVYTAENPLDPDGPLSKQRGYVESVSGHAALYYPWIAVTNPASIPGQPATVLVPPSGHLAGVYARSDSQRGVHKAPANEMIAGALGLQQLLDDTEQGVLNSWGVDVIRIFPGQARPVIWGARTTAPKDELPWRFINVRRLFIFIEKSIQSGIRWAVFEPNSVTLWKQLARTITEFLTRVWGSGALAGRSAAEAFYVKIDEELNPPSLQAAGQVVVEVGIAPVRPAEFVIVRISMWNGSTSVSEE